jgi:hypothetical protein
MNNFDALFSISCELFIDIYGRRPGVSESEGLREYCLQADTFDIDQLDELLREEKRMSDNA